MVVGVLIAELYFTDVASLKDKRRLLKSILDKIKYHFNVSVAELAKQDAWQLAVIGVAFISNESSHVHQTLAAVNRFLEGTGKAEVIKVQTELL